VNALALVAIGGAVGASCRYLVSAVLIRDLASGFPLATLVINLLGCLLIGLWAGLATRHAWLNGDARLLLVTGVLGGFTTFSAFGLESLHLLRRGAWLLGGVYVSTSVVVGLALVLLGWWLGNGVVALSKG